MATEKEAAYILYQEGVPQSDISKILGKTPATITKWKTEGEWDAKRTAAMLKRQEAEEDIWEVINYQLRVLKHTKESFERKWDEGEEPQTLPKGAIDTIRDLFKCISAGKNAEWTTYVKIIRELLAFIRKQNSILAKDVSDIFDDFLNDKRKNLD